MPNSPERRITLRDVAHKAGLSVMTVSYAFSEPGRVSEQALRRVLQASDELGYQGKNPWARSLRTGTSHTLGVVFGENLTYAFSDPQAAEFLSGVASVCVELDLGLTFIPTSGADGDAQRVSAAPVDGYVFWTTVDDDPSLGAAVATRRPCAIQGGPLFPGVALVGPDDRLAARTVAGAGLAGGAHPVVVSFSLDHERISRAEFGLDIERARLPVTRERLLGFQDGLADRGFSWDEVYVIALSRNLRTEAKEAFGALLDSREIPADSVLCMSDELAVGVLEAVRERGKVVPSDVAVTGWDNGPSASAERLTTVKQSLYDQGRMCGQIAAGLPSQGQTALWSVVERESTRR